MGVLSFACGKVCSSGGNYPFRQFGGNDVENVYGRPRGGLLGTSLVSCKARWNSIGARSAWQVFPASSASWHLLLEWKSVATDDRQPRKIGARGCQQKQFRSRSLGNKLESARSGPLCLLKSLEIRIAALLCIETHRTGERPRASPFRDSLPDEALRAWMAKWTWNEIPTGRWSHLNRVSPVFGTITYM